LNYCIFIQKTETRKKAVSHLLVQVGMYMDMNTYLTNTACTQKLWDTKDGSRGLVSV